MPDDLIEATWEDGRIYIANADEVSVPVRLTADEITGLLLALDFLAADPLRTGDAVDSARAKLRRAAPEAVSGESAAVAPPAPPADVIAAVSEAVSAGTALAIEYYVPSRDELTARVVSPRALRLDGGWYLDAYCHSSQGERSFAVERIRSIAAAEAPSPPPAASRSADGESVELVFAPESAWVADELDAERDYDVDGAGTVRARFRARSGEWLRSLLISHGRGVRSAAPAEAAAEAADVLEIALAMYREVT